MTTSQRVSRNSTLLSLRRHAPLASIASLALAMIGCGGESPSAEGNVNSTSDALLGNWQTVGLTAGSGPSAAALSSWAANRLDVWIIGGDGRLYHTVRNEGATPAWQGWDSLGPPPGLTFVGDPAAISVAPNVVDLVVSASDGNLYHAHYDGSVGWSAWLNLGDAGCSINYGEFVVPVHATNPSLTSWSSNRLDLWARCGATTLAHNVKSSSDSWDGWAAGGTLTSPDGAIVAGPASISRGDNSLDVAIQTLSGAVFVGSYGASAWAPWSKWGTMTKVRSLSMTRGSTSASLRVWATPTYYDGVIDHTTLQLLDAPGHSTKVAEVGVGAVPVAALLRTGSSTVDIVRNFGSYTFARWTPPFTPPPPCCW